MFAWHDDNSKHRSIVETVFYYYTWNAISAANSLVTTELRLYAKYISKITNLLGLAQLFSKLRKELGVRFFSRETLNSAYNYENLAFLLQNWPDRSISRISVIWISNTNVIRDRMAQEHDEGSV